MKWTPFVRQKNLTKGVIFMPSPFNYRLTIERDKLGRSYLKAYKNVWDRLKKQSRRSEKFHVGTLGDNDSIVFAETFLERFPSFKKGFFYYFFAHSLNAQISFFGSGGFSFFFAFLKANCIIFLDIFYFYKKIYNYAIKMKFLNSYDIPPSSFLN